MAVYPFELVTLAAGCDTYVPDGCRRLAASSAIVTMDLAAGGSRQRNICHIRFSGNTTHGLSVRTRASVQQASCRNYPLLRDCRAALH